MTPSVELHEAYFFVCDSCGRDSFGRLIEPEMGEDERREILDAMGAEPWHEGALLACPETVTCTHCGETFRVESPHDGDDDREAGS